MELEGPEFSIAPPPRRKDKDDRPADKPIASATSTIDHWIDAAITTTPILDVHTHLYPPAFGNMLLYGIDELINYHYLIAETVRAGNITAPAYYALPQAQQTDFIWRTLFIERAPIGEACRGVLTVLKRFGLDVASKNLSSYREFFRNQTPAAQVDRVMKMANVKTIVMTNDPFDTNERDIWMGEPQFDRHFKAVLRIDPLLMGWPDVAAPLNAMEFEAGDDLGTDSMREVRRFLNQWLDRMNAIYIAASLPPSWRYPDDSPSTRILNEAVLPICRDRNLPMALMIGVNKQVNPQLRLAGDSVSKADIRSLERVLAGNPGNKFMVTMLARENQHELAVTARKFRNLFIFGCWWFMNNPILIEEITRMRMELLGTSFCPQHSDARVLEQLVYKWDHSRAIIAKVLKDKFRDLAATGWTVTEHEVRQTVEGFFGANFEQFQAMKL